MEHSLPGPSVHGISQAGILNTGVVCHVLLQGIFLTQGLNLGLLHSRQILYQLSHQGNSVPEVRLCFHAELSCGHQIDSKRS